MSQPQDVTERLYQKLVLDAKRMNLRRLTYRCRNRRARCQLLDAIQTPQGIILHQKRYKFSPGLNATLSSEAGRQRNTLDGFNHWPPGTYFLGASALAYPEDEGPASHSLQCDHLKKYDLTSAEFAQDWLVGGEVLLPRVVL